MSGTLARLLNIIIVMSVFFIFFYIIIVILRIVCAFTEPGTGKIASACAGRTHERRRVLEIVTSPRVAGACASRARAPVTCSRVNYTPPPTRAHLQPPSRLSSRSVFVRLPDSGSSGKTGERRRRDATTAAQVRSKNIADSVGL